MIKTDPRFAEEGGIKDFGYSSYFEADVDDQGEKGSQVPFYKFDKEGLTTELNNQYRIVYETVRMDLREAKKKDFMTSLVPLAEALKVRVISKGPAKAYFLLKPVQKFMHKIMRHHSTFRLIGEPVDFHSFESLKKVSGEWLSVDYTSATDLLNPQLSEWCVDELCKVVGLPEDLTEYFHLALTGHMMRLDADYTKGEDHVYKKQQWGQLMGSIVSFPILCLINAALCRLSYEIGHKDQFPWGVDLKKCPLLVNGDDGLLRCNLLTRKVWEQIAALGGLSPSDGKVYFHKNYLNINSTSFWFESETNSFIHLPYVNMGLMTGMTRSEGLVSLNQLVTAEEKQFNSQRSIGSRHRDLIKSCPKEIQIAVHRQFVHRNFSLLSAAKVPWYVPESLGGVGLYCFLDSSGTSYLNDPITGARLGPSDLDLRCIRLLFQKQVRVPLSKLPATQPLEARQAWYSLKGFNIETKYELTENLFSRALSLKRNQEEIFGLLDTAAYYLTPLLVLKEMRKHPLTQLRTNQRAWSKLTREALSRPNLLGFTVLKDTYVYRSARFIPHFQKERVRHILTAPGLDPGVLSYTELKRDLLTSTDILQVLDFDQEPMVVIDVT